MCNNVGLHFTFVCYKKLQEAYKQDLLAVQLKFSSPWKEGGVG